MDISILNTIKKLLGIEADYTHFDVDIITHINTALMILTQLGVGDPNGFCIEDADAHWADFLDSEGELAAAKTFIYLQVKKVFDPPTSSFVMESMNRITDELTWRLNVAAE